MNKLKLLAIPALLLSLSTMAQTQTSSKGSVGRTINKIGNKTAEVAVKGTAAVGDKVYKGKVAPNGQTVYINKHSHYYWVNARGKKIYISKSKLVDDPKK
ncbi:hypothetical protein [Mucilaginibacter ginkgonis]|uniref:Uncharacterized protein n=1 Tax=Mucilaginibacter ginkgonis TaxID=2682091 RepID=A0A6I4I2J4_9SPHI|nr:hypothetical protein [Mucilaginibacter ginkgonis]QQL49503.1 hypothetical protein GO620_015215 [Mucilaginibacter ginkgonis]